MCFSTLQCGSWIDARSSVRASRVSSSFSTLQCGSWIDAAMPMSSLAMMISVSVPFNAGRGLMLMYNKREDKHALRFSTLQCGSWIDARHGRVRMRLVKKFQYPSMRVVD